MPVADVLATAEPGVVVEMVGGPAVVSHELEHGGDLATESCTRTAASDWYFARAPPSKGASSTSCSSTRSATTPSSTSRSSPTTASQEPDALQALVVPRRSRVTIPVQDSVLRQTRSPSTCTPGPAASSPSRRRSSTTSSSTARSRHGIALSRAPPRRRRCGGFPRGTTRNGGPVQIVDGQLLAVTTQRRGEGGRDRRRGRARRRPSGSRRRASRWSTSRPACPLDSDIAVVATARAVDGRRSRRGRAARVVVVLVVDAPASRAPLGSTVTATRWVMPVPDVDVDVIVTVFNPGPDPVTARCSRPATSTGGRPDERAELRDRGRQGEDGSPRRPRRRPIACVVTANHPVVVGYTVLGNAGAAMSAALPDLTADPGPHSPDAAPEADAAGAS